MASGSCSGVFRHAEDHATVAVAVRQGRGRSAVLPFAAVNRPGAPGYVRGLQRHHLVPRALARQRCFSALLAGLASAAGLHDFRRNGLLLPDSEIAALRTGLPLHRGPHRTYTEMVAERLGEIERGWSSERRSVPLLAHAHAGTQIAQLQSDLRRSLLDPRRTLRLNRHDRLGAGMDFSILDAMVDRLWSQTQPANGAVLRESSAIAA